MKVLIVLSQPPLPEGGAPGKCAVGLLRGLRGHGVDVRAIAAKRPFAIEGSVPSDLPVEIVSVPPEPKTWGRHWDRWSRPRGELSRGAFAARVREAAAGVDILHLEETETAWCDRGLALPALVHMHYLVRRDRRVTPPWTREFRQFIEEELAELTTLRRHRTLVASSPVIAAELRRRAPRAEVRLVPLCLDPADYAPAPLDGPPVAGIIGTATWPPTARAIRRLVERVWPSVSAQVPDAVLRIAGRGVDRLGMERRPNIEILGEVDSARSFLQGVSVLLYPLERGSGVKVKVLEAIASGVPVVTTPDGSEGIEAGPGVIIGLDDGSLVSATVAILRDDLERRERGWAARCAFEQRYAPTPATAPLVELYRRLGQER